MHDATVLPAPGEGLATLEANEFGRVTAINARFSQEFGWSSEAIVGRPLLALVPGQLDDAFNARFSRFVEFGVAGTLGQPMPLPVVTGEGETVMTETHLQAGRIAGHWRLRAEMERIVPAEKS